MRDKIANILWGLALIAIGIIVGGKVIGLELSISFGDWWPLLIIFPCFVSMLRNGPGPVNVILMLCGVLLLLEAREKIDKEMIANILLPAVFIVIGVFLLFGSIVTGERRRYHGRLLYTATFAGNVVVPSDGGVFQGCAAEAVFGGLDLDLRSMEIENGAVIDAVGIFGGVDILVPPGVNVKLKRTALFGGAKNRTGSHGGETVLYVNALCMFGGVDIK